jgi:hypothetical protein
MKKDKYSAEYLSSSYFFILEEFMQGTITVVNIRDKHTLIKNTSLIRVDRTNALLGNPFILKNKNDDIERVNVIEKHSNMLKRDMKLKGMVYHNLLALAERVLAGENLYLECWCSPKACHADSIKREIEILCKNITDSNRMKERFKNRKGSATADFDFCDMFEGDKDYDRRF